MLFAAWNIGFAFCAASLVGKVVRIETKWRYDRVEKTMRVVGRARDCVRRSLAKAMLPLEKNELWSHCEFCASGGEACAVSIKVAQR